MRLSLTAKIWLITFLIDLPFSAIVPFAFLWMLGVSDSAQLNLIIRLIVMAYVAKIALWTPLQIFTLREVEPGRRAADNLTDDDLLRAGRAAYSFPLVHPVPYASLWAGQYVGVTLVLLTLYPDQVPLVPQAVNGMLLFCFALFAGVFLVNIALTGFLIAPVAGFISVEARRRGLKLQGRSLLFRYRMIVLAFGLALAPIGWMSSVGYMFDVRANLRNNANEAVILSGDLARVIDEGGAIDPVLDGRDALQVFSVSAAGEVSPLRGGAPSPESVQWLQARRGERSFINRGATRTAGISPYAGGWIGVEHAIESASSPEFLLTIAFFFIVAVFWSPMVAWLIGRSVGDPVRSIGATLRDIMEQRGFDKVQRLAIPQLDEIGVLAEGANQMLDRLEEATDRDRRRLRQLSIKNQELIDAARAKSQFLANMSHELRTPLNAILGFSRILERKTRELIPERQTKNIRLIHESGQALLALVNDLLDFERVEAGKLELRPGDVNCVELASLLQSTLRPAAEEKGMTLSVEVVDAPLKIHVDPDRLRQIATNLISNAIKYSDEGHVSFRIYRHPAKNVRAVRFECQDQGIGIPEAQLARIFDPFHQVDGSMTREREGVGLGLAIVKKLANLLGGDMSVESEVGVGSKFTLTLPGSVRVGEEADSLPPVGVGPLLLVIDDQRDFLESMRDELSEAGYRVHAASSGERGIEKALDLIPDAILLDIHMPGIDGWETLRRLRATPALKEIPVFITSVDEGSPQAVDLGITSWLTKPIQVDDFKRASSGLFQLSDRDVLIVEDDAATRALLLQLLTESGANPRVARDGVEAMAALDDRLPNVVVLDLMLPKRDGFSILRELRSRAGGDAVRVIVYTARELSADERATLNEGLVEIVKKQGEDGALDVLSALQRTRAASAAEGRAG